MIRYGERGIISLSFFCVRFKHVSKERWTKRGCIPGSEKLLRPTPTRRNRWCGLRPTRPRNDRAIFVSSSQEAGGEPGVWLRVRILNSPVFSFSTTVCAIRDSLREAVHLCSASLRIIGSNSVSKTSCSRVSSALRSGGSHQRQHQNPSSKGSWLQKPLLPVAQGP